jgi:uncharacterized protein
MIIRVSELPDEGLAIRDVRQVPVPYTEAAWRLDAVSLQLERDGAEVVATGEIEATVPQSCGRCLEPFPARVKAFVDVRLAPRPTTASNVELAPDDLDVDFYANDELDVSRLIETETTLALPMKPLCRDDCRGLCPVCGINRNTATCACEVRPVDPRLAVLKQWTAPPRS